MRHRKSVMTVLGVLLVALLAGCSGANEAESVPMSMLPDYVQTAPQRVREAYQFAVAHPEALAVQPCYCGCGAMGHTSNLSCYLADPAEDGSPVFDNHAAGCGICVDITHDVMRLMDQGKTPLEIRQYVDAQYSPFGPSTDTPYPQS
ncbi:MAG: hypothetical protein Kow0077_29260 [Anaerolineae bacterium]